MTKSFRSRHSNIDFGACNTNGTCIRMHVHVIAVFVRMLKLHVPFPVPYYVFSLLTFAWQSYTSPDLPSLERRVARFYSYPQPCRSSNQFFGCLDIKGPYVQRMTTFPRVQSRPRTRPMFHHSQFCPKQTCSFRFTPFAENQSKSSTPMILKR